MIYQYLITERKIVTSTPWFWVPVFKSVDTYIDIVSVLNLIITHPELGPEIADLRPLISS